MPAVEAAADAAAAAAAFVDFGNDNESLTVAKDGCGVLGTFKALFAFVSRELGVFRPVLGSDMHTSELA